MSNATPDSNDRPDQHVIIEPARLFCPAHGEHLWPSGFAIAGTRMFQAVVENEEIIALCTPPGAEHADPYLLNDITVARPMCYFVDDDTLRSIFTETGLLIRQRCDLCGVPGLAGDYSMTMPGERIEIKTVCLDCMMIGGARLHAAHPNGNVWPKRERPL
jgi:hypothetical protein